VVGVEENWEAHKANCLSSMKPVQVRAGGLCEHNDRLAHTAMLGSIRCLVVHIGIMKQSRATL
jgi:hypothetical protein